MNRIFTSLLMAVFCVSSNVAEGQVMTSMDTSGLSVNAVESFKVKPQKIQLAMWIKAQGKDAKTAIIALNNHKENVRKELEGMRAEKDSVKFSAPVISEGGSDEQRMMQMQMRAMRNNSREATPAPLPKTITAMCSLNAEWVLPVQEGDALAILPATLKEQIAARDLAGLNNKPELSDEEQERVDELEQMMQEQYGMYGSDSEQEGPQIRFIGTASSEETSAATKKAFVAATAKATALSDSMGIKLGKLRTVMARSSIELAESEQYIRNYSGYRQTASANFPSKGEREVVSTSFDDLQYSITVGLIYDLE